MKLVPYLRFLRDGLGQPLATKCIKSVFDLPIHEFKAAGVRAILFDVDDTLTANHAPFTPEIIALLQRLSADFKLGFVSNCGPVRRAELHAITQPLGIALNTQSDKPSPTGFTETLAQIQVPPEYTAMIGDRISMDLFGALQAGIRERILVQPFSAVYGGNPALFMYRWVRTTENAIWH